MGKTKVFSLRLDEGLITQLDKRCKELFETRNAHIARLIAEEFVTQTVTQKDVLQDAIHQVVTRGKKQGTKAKSEVVLQTSGDVSPPADMIWNVKVKRWEKRKVFINTI